MNKNWIFYEDGKLTVEEFFNQLIKEFPTLKAEIEEAKEIGEHLMMEVFSAYTIKQFRDNNFQELKRCFQFIENHLDNVKDEIINALYVSYCETIISEVNDSAIQNYMGRKFIEFYLEYDKHWKNFNSKTD